MKRVAALAAVVAGLFVGAPSASAAPPFAPCGENGLQCGTLSVPLDYANPSAGQLGLYVEVLPAVGTPRGVMFILAGGPGQASAETFNLGLKAEYWRAFFPGYTLVAYDDRGTGKSGALDCPTARTIADCGNAIPGRAFYTTREHAEDIESIRLALGVDKIAIWGVSYGTKHAEAYALAHPSHVERMLLDSVVLPDNNLIDPLSLRSIPGSVNKICTNNVCPGIPPGMGDKLVALANQLEAQPVSGTTHFTPRLAPFPVTLDGDALVSLAYESDLGSRGSAISSQLPAAINSALHGDYLPLERLVWMDTIVNVGDQGDVNFALLLATDCGDGPFPWGPNDPTDARRTALNAAVAALPPGAAGAFGTWALQSLIPFICVDWPSPSGGAALATGPLPDVPVLVLSGDRDVRTPTAYGVAMATRFRQGRVLVVPGAGHSVLNHSPCAANAVRSWLNGGTPPSVCTKFSPYVPPVGAWRKSIAATPPVARVPGLAGRTLAGVLQTVHDAEAYWLLLRHSHESFTGLVGGSVTPDENGAIRLVNFSSIPGLAISGSILIKIDPYGDPVAPLSVGYGQLTVGGRGAAHGKLSLSGNRLTGTLAKRKVAAAF